MKIVTVTGRIALTLFIAGSLIALAQPAQASCTTSFDVGVVKQNGDWVEGEASFTRCGDEWDYVVVSLERRSMDGQFRAISSSKKIRDYGKKWWVVKTKPSKLSWETYRVAIRAYKKGPNDDPNFYIEQEKYSVDTRIQTGCGLYDVGRTILKPSPKRAEGSGSWTYCAGANWPGTRQQWTGIGLELWAQASGGSPRLVTQLTFDPALEGSHSRSVFPASCTDSSTAIRYWTVVRPLNPTAALTPKQSNVASLRVACP